MQRCAIGEPERQPATLALSVLPPGAIVQRREAPDPERTVCLEFLSEALERIVAGTDARKALGVYDGDGPA